jgi:putative mRNA 3-end processing factor
MSLPLISWTEKGLYCAEGDFYIDPHRAVKTAVVTHAHSDHARRGCERYICVSSSVGLLKSRLSQKIQVQGIPYREVFKLGEVSVSFHSAGHILGSAQVRVQSGPKGSGEVWVASGDYKRDPDPSCEPFESVQCDTFITEATFGTPKYTWPKDRDHGRDIHAWWKRNAALGMNSVLFGYSLGKAQRILAELAPHAHQPVIIHETIEELTNCYRAEGRVLAPTLELNHYKPGTVLQGELILAPPSVLKTGVVDRLGRYQTAFASGWMQQGSGSPGSGVASWGRDYDYGFVMSDHADWNDLNRTIEETKAKRVFVQHRDGALIQHLRRRGIDAYSSDMLELKNYQRITGIYGGQNLSFAFDSAPAHASAPKSGRTIEKDLS